MRFLAVCLLCVAASARLRGSGEGSGSDDDVPKPAPANLKVAGNDDFRRGDFVQAGIKCRCNGARVGWGARVQRREGTWG